MPGNLHVVPVFEVFGHKNLAQVFRDLGHKTPGESEIRFSTKGISKGFDNPIFSFTAAPASYTRALERDAPLRLGGYWPRGLFWASPSRSNQEDDPCCPASTASPRGARLVGRLVRGE